MRWLLIGLGIAALSLALLLWPSSGVDQQLLPLEPQADLPQQAEPSAAEPREVVVLERIEPDRDPSSSKPTVKERLEQLSLARRVEGGAEALLLRAHCATEAGWPLAGVVLRTIGTSGSHRATSAASGLVELELRWPVARYGNWNTLTLEASLEGKVTLRRSVPLQEPGVVDLGTLTMGPGSDLVGRVVDEQGEGLSGARVRMAEPVVPGHEQLEQRRRIGRIGFDYLEDVDLASTHGADGSYRLRGAPAREISLVVQLQGYDVAYTPGFTPSAGTETEVPVIVLRRPTTGLRGVVRDERGPVAGAKVQLNPLDRSWRHPIEAVASDEEGRFLLGKAEPGRPNLVTITHPERKEMRLKFDNVVLGGPDIEAVFPERRWVEVLLQMADGTPLDGVLTFTNRESGWDPVVESLETGRWRFAVPNYAFELGAEAPGYSPASVGAFEHWSIPDPLTVTLSRSGLIRGRVRVHSRPRSGVEVHVHERIPGGEWSRSLQAASPKRTDRRGFFALTVEGGKEYLLHANDGRSGQAELEILDLPVGGSREGIELELAPVGSLQGRLITAPGVNPEGNVIEITCRNGHYQHKTLDDTGFFQFENLIPGVWEIRRLSNSSDVYRHRLGPRTKSPAKAEHEAVVKADEVTRYDLDESQRSTVQLTGRSELAAAHPGEWGVLVTGKDLRAEGTMDSEGNFEVVFPGSERVHLNFNMTGSDRTHWYQLHAVQLDAGDMRVDLPWPGQPAKPGQIELKGLDPQAPVDGMGNSYRLEQGDFESKWSVSFRPNPDGSWKSGPIPAGKAELRAGGIGSRRNPPLATIEVVSGEIARYEHP